MIGPGRAEPLLFPPGRHQVRSSLVALGGLVLASGLASAGVAPISTNSGRASTESHRESTRSEAMPFPMILPEPPVFPDRDVSLHDHGGIGDGRTLNTHAFARAIAACAAPGGGRVVVPPGRWLMGAIHLGSSINLHLALGSTIVFSDAPEDYLPAVWARSGSFECMNFSPLVYARDCDNIAITGHGTIDGIDNDSSRNVLVQDCNFIGTVVGIRFKSARGRGVVVENIWCCDLRLANITREAILLTTFYRAWFGSDTGMAPVFRNLHFERIHVEGAHTPIAIEGLPEQPIQNLQFRNFQVLARRDIRASEALGVQFENISLTVREAAELMTLTNTRNGTIENLNHANGPETLIVVNGSSSGIPVINTNLARLTPPFASRPTLPPMPCSSPRHVERIFCVVMHPPVGAFGHRHATTLSGAEAEPGKLRHRCPAPHRRRCGRKVQGARATSGSWATGRLAPAS